MQASIPCGRCMVDRWDYLRIQPSEDEVVPKNGVFTNFEVLDSLDRELGQNPTFKAEDSASKLREIPDVAPTPFVVLLNLRTLDGPDFSLLGFTGFCPPFKLRTCTSVNGIWGQLFLGLGATLFRNGELPPMLPPDCLRCQGTRWDSLGHVTLKNKELRSL